MTMYLLAAVLASAMAVGVDSPPSAAGDAVELAARNYRIQVYETFHTDRAEYDRRIAQWNQLNSAWHDAGEPTDGQFNLILWLVSATAQSRSDAVGPLPEMPKFAAQVPPTPPRPVAVQSEPTGKTPPAAKPINPPISNGTPATTTGATKPVEDSPFGVEEPKRAKTGSATIPPASPPAGQPAVQPAAPAKTSSGGTYLDKLRRSVNAASSARQP